MKLRRIGNSLGTTFSKETLQRAGFTGDEQLEVIASSGEIRLRRASGRLLVEFTKAEADALASGKMGTKSALAALAKVRKLMVAE